MIDILVVGEICQDIFIYGFSNRLSPEAPVPIMTPISTVENLGMSGNVVENLKAIEKNIKITHWYQKEKITKTRFVDKKTNHMFLRIDDGESSIVPFVLSEHKLNNLKKFDILIVSDYNKGFLNEKNLIDLSKNSKLSILDSKRKLNRNIIDSFSFVKLNEKEYLNNSEFIDAKNIIVTLGERGAKFLDVHYESPNPQETIDVSGAGDTFTASFILEYFKTKNVEKSIVFANQMSSIVVSKRGVATP